MNNISRVFVYLSICVAAVFTICAKVESFIELWILPVAFLCCLVGLHLLFWIFIIAVSLTINFKKNYEKLSNFYYGVLNIGYKYLLSTARVKLFITGADKVPDGAFLLVSNHLSRFDNMVHSAVLSKKKIIYISKPSNFKIPIARRFMKRNCYLPIDRENARNAIVTIRKAQEFIKNGEASVGIFPEGSRSKDFELHDFKPGSLRIAVKTGCPIVVASIWGTQNICRRFPFRSTKVYFDIVDVIYPDKRKTVDLSDEIHSMLKSHLDEVKENEKK